MGDGVDLRIGRVQVRRPHRDGWTKARRTTFLDHLSMTANARLSAEAAGLSPRGAYTLRRRDPEFAEAWRQALEIAFERLREGTLSRAIHAEFGAGGAVADGEGEIAATPPDPATLKWMMTQGETLNGYSQSNRRIGRRPKTMTPAELTAELEKRFAALARRLKAKKR